MILSLISCFKKKDIQKAEITPKVSLIITAHNEEKVIQSKIENALELNYPKEKLEIIVASDGSNDKTNEIVSEYAKKGIKLYAQKDRRGKSRAQNEVVERVKGEIIVFTDTDTLFKPNFLSILVKSFADPGVGCVEGELHFIRDDNSVSKSQGLYWRYELLLRRLESKIGSLAFASGAPAWL